LNAFAYLSEYDQSDCGLSHLEMSKYIYGCFNLGSHTFDCDILDVTEFTTLTPLLISCKLSFPTVSLKTSSLPTLALKSENRIFILYLDSLLNIPIYLRISP
jgi:hypothetical protein